VGSLTLTLTVCAVSSTLSQRTALAETHDVLRFVPPKGWTKVPKNDPVEYRKVDSVRGEYCQVHVYKSFAAPANTPEVAFENSWRAFTSQWTMDAKVERSPIQDLGAWKRRTTLGSFVFEKKPVIMSLTTYYGSGRIANVLTQCNGQQFLPELDAMLRSLELSSNSPAATVDQGDTVANPSPARAPASGFQFTNTTFDDGWSATETEGWAEVRKGALRVHVHYPHPQADAYNSVLRNGDINAWNLLVAPRYTNVRNFEWKSIQSFESITFLHADATEKATGRPVYVVLFKKHVSTGRGRYLEFVAPNRAAYEAEFGPFRKDEFGWEKLSDMQSRNRFAVAAADLVGGTWAANDYASLQYYYVNTGGYAGATATSTADQFTFLPGNRYESDHSGASGMVGNMKFNRVVYKGASTVTNWSMVLTNRFQGQPETYQCAFEAIRGGRILVLKDRLGTTWSLIRKR
jgi:hypothetical protein